MIDPMCGSGTFLAEAAMIATNYPPGLLRLSGEAFGFMRWHHFDHARFNDGVGRVRKFINDTVPILRGFDHDPKMVKIARENIARLELECEVRIQERSVQTLTNDDLELKPGKRIMVTNPPGGERMTGDGDIDQLYREVGQTLATTFDGNRKFVLLSEDAPLRKLQQRVKRERWVHNGRSMSVGRPGKSGCQEINYTANSAV